MARGNNTDGVTIEAAALAKAMKHAAAVIENRNTIPILSNVRLTCDGDTLEIVTTNLDLEFRQRLPIVIGEKLAITVEAKRLSMLASAVEPGAQMALSLDGARLVVKSGRSRWVLPALPVADFPVIPFDGGTTALEIDAEVLSSAIARVIWAAGAEEHRPYLHGPLLHSEDGRTALVTTDGYSLVRVVTECEHPADAPEVILGPKFCRAVQSLASDMEGAVSLSWDTAKARASIGDVTLVGKLIEGTYPEYRRLLAEGGVKVVVDPTTLRSAIRRVSLVAADKTRIFKLERGDGKLTLSVASQDTGSASEEVLAEAEAAHANGFNCTFVERMLEAIGGDSVEITQTDPGAIAVFRRVVPDGAIGLVMPVAV